MNDVLPKEPPYDTLVVGKDFRRAYRGGVLVDERTGEPLEDTRARPLKDAQQRQEVSGREIPGGAHNERRGVTPKALRARKNSSVTCEVCGVTFSPYWPAKTCSPRCRQRLSRQRRRVGVARQQTAQNAREAPSQGAP